MFHIILRENQSINISLQNMLVLNYGNALTVIILRSFVETVQYFLAPLLQTSFKNIVAKEEIAHREQFLFLPLCF